MFVCEGLIERAEGDKERERERERERINRESERASEMDISVYID